jgi:hypothetical protein
MRKVALLATLAVAGGSSASPQAGNSESARNLLWSVTNPFQTVCYALNIHEMHKGLCSNSGPTPKPASDDVDMRALPHPGVTS